MADYTSFPCPCQDDHTLDPDWYKRWPLTRLAEDLIAACKKARDADEYKPAMAEWVKALDTAAKKLPGSEPRGKETRLEGLLRILEAHFRQEANWQSTATNRRPQNQTAKIIHGARRGRIEEVQYEIGLARTALNELHAQDQKDAIRTVIERVAWEEIKRLHEKAAPIALVWVPDFGRAVLGRFNPPAGKPREGAWEKGVRDRLVQWLDSNKRRGILELREESGVGRLSKADAAFCPLSADRIPCSHLRVIKWPAGTKVAERAPAAAKKAPTAARSDLDDYKEKALEMTPAALSLAKRASTKTEIAAAISALTEALAMHQRVGVAGGADFVKKHTNDCVDLISERRRLQDAKPTAGRRGAQSAVITPDEITAAAVEIAQNGPKKYTFLRRKVFIYGVWEKHFKNRITLDDFKQLVASYRGELRLSRLDLVEAIETEEGHKFNQLSETRYLSAMWNLIDA